MWQDVDRVAVVVIGADSRFRPGERLQDVGARAVVKSETFREARRTASR